MLSSLYQEHPQLKELTEDLKAEVERESGGVTKGSKNKPRTVKSDSKDRPRKPPSPFIVFFKENNAQIKASNPDMTGAELRAKAGSIWRESLDPERKAEYKRRNKVQWEEYFKEVAAYEEKASSMALKDAVKSCSHVDTLPPNAKGSQ